jgi:dTDP-4-amino-4,6-dideoxygalactose transaminase
MIGVTDPKRSAARGREEIIQALGRVVDSGWYILGGEVGRFERDFSAYIGLSEGIAVASGTDAITLSLMALGLGPDEGVIIPPNTAFPTACAITRAGGVPVFVDVDPRTYLLDPGALLALLRESGPSRHGVTIRGIVPVHLYGHPCDMDPIMAAADEFGLFVVEDCAQAHGARYRGKPVGTFGAAAAFSFYPTKNLAALGDAGAVVTNDTALARSIRSMRDYGQTERYRHDHPGMNSRMDDLQAAVLSLRLKDLDENNARRRKIADRYRDEITGPFVLPEVMPYAHHVFHLFVIRSDRRSGLMDHLTENGIGYAVHYPRPIHLQPIYRGLGYRPGDLPIAERCAEEIISIPIFPELTDDETGRVISALNAFAEGGTR